MIHSTVGGNDSSWMDPIQSQNAGPKSLDHGFSHLSLSNFGDNRPPGLSTSSISSMGEDPNPNPSWQTNNSNNITNSSKTIENSLFYPPPSPHTSSPTMSNNNNININNNHHILSSPKIARINSHELRPSTAGSNSNNHDQQTNLEFNRKRSHSQPNNTYAIFASSQSSPTNEPIWIQQRQQGQEKANIRTVSSDLSDDMGLGNWSAVQSDHVLTSPISRSGHSLQNMGSVDENEQFLGNRGRARTLPTGNSAFHSMGMVDDNLRVRTLSTGNGLQSMGSVDENEQFLGSSRTRSRTQSAGNVYLSYKKNNYGNDYNHNGSPTFSRDRNSKFFAETPGSSISIGHLQGQDLSCMKFQSPSSNGQHQLHHAMVSNFPYVHNSSHDLREPISENEFSTPPSQQIHHNRQRVMSADAVSYRRLGTSPRIENIINHSPMMGDSHLYIDGHNAIMDHPVHFFSQMNPNPNDKCFNRRMPESMPYYQSHGVIAGTPARVIYTVKFKRSQRNFVLSPHILGDIKIGTYVKVEADRGEDLGIVLSRVPAEKFNLSSRLSGSPEMKKILNVATNEEIALLQIKREEEDELLKICRGKTEQRSLPMNVVDAEYQFDRHKLTFFFEAEGRIDFRELVRELFSIYKTRIWMQQIDKNSSCTNNITVATSAPCETSNDTNCDKQPMHEKSSAKSVQ